MLIVGLDIGFGNVKRAVGKETDGVPQIDVWLAVALPAKQFGRDLLGASLSDDEIEIDGAPWKVGVDPEQAGASGQVLHDGYVGSPAWRAQMIYALKNHKRIGRLVLGLPSDEWQSERLREAVSASARTTCHEVGIVVDEILVLPQPLGGYIDANAREGGELIRQRVLVVDPGRYTVDWTLFVGGRLRDEGTGSDRQGAVSRIVEGVMSSLHDEYNAKIDEGRVRKSLEADGKIMVRGSMVDCSQAIARISAQVVDTTIGIIVRTLRIESDVDRVVLTGGGAPFYLERLRERFGADLVREAHNPVEANARGYWWYGAHSR